jgi:dephospho-CoA kinase
MILGITGGLGCGKSTAARLFERHGFRRLDSDALVREKVLPSALVRAQLNARYGTAIVRENGVIDRATLAERVFSNQAELNWLEQLIHPLVYSEWRMALAAEPGLRWAVEVPLLFEQALENWFDFTVCVACAESEQLVRLEKRGMNRALAGQRISKQWPVARKIELADFVLWNEGSADFLQEQVDRLWIALSTQVPAPV